MIRPLGNRLLVQLEDGEKMVGRIHIPDTAQKKTRIATVIEVGPGKRDETGDYLAIPLQVGERVIVSEYSGTQIELEGQKLLVVSLDECVAVVEGEGAH